MNIFSIIGNILGIGKDALSNRAKLKQLKVDNKFKLEEATTNAHVKRINSETEGDLSIDLITARDKNNTKKDLNLSAGSGGGPQSTLRNVLAHCKAHCAIALHK